MLATERDRLKQDIDEIVRRHGRDRGALIPMLQEIQRKYRGIDEFAMQALADAMGLHPTEVHSVVSFYSFLDEKPKGKFVIRLCSSISCQMVDGQSVGRQLEADLGVEFGQTTSDGMFTLEHASCLGMCDQGPAMMVNERMHTRVTPPRIYEILQQCRSQSGSSDNENQGHKQ